MPKVSIVIPTYGDRAYDLLKPCLDSIHQFTNLDDCEIIVVANGCTGTTSLLCNGVDWIKLLWFDEALGYPAACNEGIKIAKGDYIVLLNNDTILLEQPKNQWIEILLRAFWDEKMAIAGPWMNWCPWAEHDFLIFFCVMIRRSVFETIGLLDEKAFGVGYGEDCDLCCKAKAAGFKIAQVPIPDKVHYDGRMALGQFPIYHAGNQTFANWPGGEELLRKNRAILRERYGTNISKAHDLDGWISDDELRWLAQTTRQHQTVIELGSWHGKSARAIADNLPENGRLYCIDTWAGSKVEQDTNHASARGKDGDAAFLEFTENLWDHIESGKVVPLRLNGCHAAHLLHSKSVTADFIFIDGGHSKGETLTDISLFLPLLKKGGVIAGHDYKSGLWPDVTTEVLGVFGEYVGNPENTTIWYTDANLGGTTGTSEATSESAIHAACFPATTENKTAGVQVPASQPKIYDCFIFNNEHDILRKRLLQLGDVVDRFVIVEATKTHSGKPKEPQLEKSVQNWAKFAHKITYIIVDDLPEVEGSITDKSWARERHQRDAIMRGLTECKSNDIIIISDVDEIPSVEAIQSFNGTDLIRSFDMELYYYDETTKAVDPWREAKIIKYGLLKAKSPCWARYQKADPIPNGGEHLSYFGGVDSIQKKLENTAHREYDTPHFKDPERIRKAIEEKRDLFDRDYVKFK